MRVYLAARFTRRLELRRYALELEAFGHVDCSSWLWEDVEELREVPELELVSGDQWLMLAQEIAVRNWQDLRGAEMSIHFTDAPHVSHPFGARHVELGIALSMPRHSVMVVGPREHLFHCLSPMMLQRIDSWEEARELLSIGHAEEDGG